MRSLIKKSKAYIVKELPEILPFLLSVLYGTDLSN